VNPVSLNNYHLRTHVCIILRLLVPFWQVRNAADAICEAVDRVANGALEALDQPRVNPFSLNSKRILIHIRIHMFICVPIWQVRNAADAICEAVDRVANGALEALDQPRANPFSLNNYHLRIHVRIPMLLRVPIWKVRDAADAVCEAVDRVANGALEAAGRLGRASPLAGDTGGGRRRVRGGDGARGVAPK